MNSFAVLLQTEFEKRKALNARYSLRAFAHSLKIDAPTLHHLMAGRRTAGPKRQAKLLKALGLKPDADESRPSD